jgi:hypothetical protein
MMTGETTLVLGLPLDINVRRSCAGRQDKATGEVRLDVREAAAIITGARHAETGLLYESLTTLGASGRYSLDYLYLSPL